MNCKYCSPPSSYLGRGALALALSLSCHSLYSLSLYLFLLALALSLLSLPLHTSGSLREAANINAIANSAVVSVSTLFGQIYNYTESRKERKCSIPRSISYSNAFRSTFLNVYMIKSYTHSGNLQINELYIKL